MTNKEEIKYIKRIKCSVIKTSLFKSRKFAQVSLLLLKLLNKQIDNFKNSNNTYFLEEYRKLIKRGIDIWVDSRNLYCS